MKIRTDFVTNSSSSSFVTARIKVTDEDLLAMIGECSGVSVSDNIISISDDEVDYGFGGKGETPEKVIDCLLELIKDDFGKNKKYKMLLKKKEELVSSIEEYDVETGETGNSENEYLLQNYIYYVIDGTELDYDEVNEELLDMGAWLKSSTKYQYKKGEDVQIEHSYDGPMG